MDPPKLSLLLLLMFASNVNAQDYFPAGTCGSTGNFTADDTYQTTLTTLLSSISTTNSLSLTYGFFNASSAVSGASQTLYIIGSCHGDLTGESCRACLNDAASDIRSLCPVQKEAVLFRENCTIRYSNASSFGTVVVKPIYPLYNVNNASIEVTYTLGVQMGELQAEAADGGSLRKYATREISVGQERIFAMAQCTPDLTKQQCIDCLQTIVGTFRNCCLGKAGFRNIAPSCQFRYETYRFFDPVGEPLPPPPPPPPPPGSLALV